jgi:hypothetical protein
LNRYRFITKRCNPRLLLSFALLFAVLANSSALRADEIQERFADAMAAVEADQLNTARRLLAELVADYPTLYRARLELASTNYLARDFDAADAELSKVLEDPELPPSVRVNLLAFQAQIRDDRRTFEKRHRWNAQAYLGGMYDSNVNFGVARDIVDIAGFPVRVLPLSQEISDYAVVLDAGALHTYNPGKSFQAGENTGYVIWQTQFNGYYRDYFDESEYDLGVVTLRTGPAWVVPQEWSASIGLQADQIWLGSEQLGLFLTVNPNFTWEIDETTQISAALSYTKRTYEDDIDIVREGDLYRGNLIYSKVFQQGLFGLNAGIGYSDFNAEEELFSFTGPEAFVGGNWNTWEQGTLYGSVGYRQFNFKGVNPLFGESRDDDEYRFIIGFRQLLSRTWALKTEYIYTNNKSTLGLFDFDRNQVAIGVQKAW